MLHAIAFFPMLLAAGVAAVTPREVHVVRAVPDDAAVDVDCSESGCIHDCEKFCPNNSTGSEFQTCLSALTSDCAISASVLYPWAQSPFVCSQPTVGWGFVVPIEAADVTAIIVSVDMGDTAVNCRDSMRAGFLATEDEITLCQLDRSVTEEYKVQSIKVGSHLVVDLAPLFFDTATGAVRIPSRSIKLLSDCAQKVDIITINTLAYSGNFYGKAPRTTTTTSTTTTTTTTTDKSEATDSSVTDDREADSKNGVPSVETGPIGATAALLFALMFQ